MRFIRFPKKPPSSRVLSVLSQFPAISSLSPLRTSHPHPRTSSIKFSKLPYKLKDELWKVAILAGFDPIHTFGVKEFQKSKPLESVPMKNGHERIVKSFVREKKINENMRKMPEILKQFKSERLKQKEASKPDLPF